MRKEFLALAVLALALVIVPKNNAQDDGGNVTVNSTYVNDGHGIAFSISSSVDDVTCVIPYVKSQDNVYGGIAGPYQLQPNEENISIGQFNQADASQAWSVYVGAKWHKGTC